MSNNRAGMKTDSLCDFIYARKSTEDARRQVASIPDQLGISHNLVSKHLAVVSDENIFTDTKTGMKGGVRIGFNTMFRKILGITNSGGKCRIFTWKACRLARNGTDGGPLEDLIRDGKLTIVTDVNGIYDEPRWHEFHNDCGYNSKYSKDLSLAVTRNNNYKASLGIYPGRPHLGYMYNPDKPQGLKDHIPNPRNWDNCREWIVLMLSGNYTVEQSLEIMTARGLVGNKGEPVSKTKAYFFFKDIFNTGLFILKNSSYKGIHKPLLTMAEYNKIQKIIDGRGNTQKWGNPLWFQGIDIFKCGFCGGSITGEKHIKHYKNGSNGQFFHARCTKKLGPCPEKYLNAKEMEGQIKSYLDEMQVADEYINLIRRILKRRNQEEFQRANKEHELRTKRLADVSRQKEALYGMKAEGFYDNRPEEYEQKKAELLKMEILIKQEIMPDVSWRL